MSLQGKQENRSLCASRHNISLSVYLFLDSKLELGKSKEFNNEEDESTCQKSF